MALAVPKLGLLQFGGNAAKTATHRATDVAMHQVTNSAGVAVAGIGNFTSIFSVGTIGIAGAASFIMNQIDYALNRKSLLELYKDEVGAQLNKSAGEVTVDDLELVAKGNPEAGIKGNKAIADELHKMQRSRNIRFFVTAASLLLTFGVMGAMGAFAASVGLAGATTTFAIGDVILKTLAGVTLHRMLEEPLHKISHKLFGVEDTVSENIAALTKQYNERKPISREQVVGVFVASNDDLKKFVKDRYRKSYSDLTIAQKREVTEIIAQYIPADAITENLNMGRIKVTELAFAVEGQKSGVIPNSVENPIGMSTDTRGWLDTIAHKLHIGKKDAKEKEEFSYAPKARKVMEYDNPEPKVSHADRISKEREISHANSRA